MTHDAPNPLRAKLDALVQVSPKKGGETWSARDLWEPLGYAKWESFAKIIARAIATRRESGLDCAFHFRELVSPAGDADFRLTRLACHLVTLAGDGRKKAIASARDYFAESPAKPAPKPAKAAGKSGPAAAKAKSPAQPEAAAPVAAPESSPKSAKAEPATPPRVPGKPAVNTGSRFIPQSGGNFQGKANRKAAWNPNLAVSRGYPNSAARTGR